METPTKKPEAVGLDNLRLKSESMPVVAPGFGSLQSFEFTVRAARVLSASSLVPEIYRGEAGLPNCIIALNMSARIGADPLMVMQNLYIIEGKPSWSSQFIIAAINNCGRFSPLRFDIRPDGTKRTFKRTTSYWSKKRNERVEEEETAEFANYVCTAWAIEKATGDRLESPPVSIELSFREGWYSKNGSKWQTMPELMLRYRSAAFFGRLYAPELLMGLQTAEEIGDVIDVQPTIVPTFQAPPPPPPPASDPGISAEEAGEAAGLVEKVLDADLAQAAEHPKDPPPPRPPEDRPRRPAPSPSSDFSLE